MRGPAAAERETGAVLHPARDVALDPVALDLPDQRSHLHGPVGGIADLHSFEHAHHLVEDVVVHRRVDEHPGRVAAALALMADVRPRRSGRHGVEVGIGEHDVGRLAAEFEEQALHGVSGAAHDARADDVGTGERHHVDQRMRRELLAGGRVAGDNVDHARREVRSLEHLGERERLERRVRRGLQHDGVAHRERGPELPEVEVQREVERRDRGDHAHGLLEDRARAGAPDRRQRFDVLERRGALGPVGEVGDAGGGLG